MLEIDGVRQQIEKLIWESGDYISDEYLKLIDLSTSPDRNVPRNALRMASAVRRLNRNLDTTSSLIVGTDVAWAYDCVIAQLNDMNADMPEVGTLLPLNQNESRHAGSSGSFKWAHDQ